MKKIRIIAIAFLAMFAMAATSCYSVKLQDLTADPDYNGNRTSEFKIYRVLQIDDVNVSGIDIMEYFDFFSTYRLSLTYKDGKISKMSIDNGDIPFSKKYGYVIPGGTVDVYFDNSVNPNCIRRSDNDDILATFNKGVLVLDFKLDCASVSYRYMFTGVKSE